MQAVSSLPDAQVRSGWSGPRRAAVGAWLAWMAASPAETLAQAPAAPEIDCGAANLQRADELLQATSAARRQHSSLSFAWKLVPIDAQLKALKAQQQAEGASPATCQKLASRIDAEQARLLKLVPDLRLVAAAPAPQMAPAAAALAAPAAQLPETRTQQICAADTAQSAADLAQRFVHFMQTAGIQPGGLLPYQSFSRRLTGLDAGLSARPDDCPGHRATLAQLNTEFQQLVSMDARAAVPAGQGLPDGSMPLLSTPAAQACVVELRQGFRDSQAATSRSLLTLAEGPERASAQWLHQRVLWQQVDALARGPLSPESCEQARLALRAPADVSAPRAGTALAAAPRSVPVLPAAAPPQAAAPVVAPPLQRQPAPAMAAAAPSSEEDDHRACIEYTRHTYGQLEREGSSLKSSGRLSAPEAASFDRDLATYREWLRKGTHPIQCGVLADQLTKHLAMVRYASANLPAQATPRATAPAAPARAVPDAPAPTVAGPAPSPPTPVRQAAVAVPPVAPLARPPTAAPAVPPAVPAAAPRVAPPVAPPAAPPVAPPAAPPVAPRVAPKAAAASAVAPARARAPAPPQAPKSRELER